MRTTTTAATLVGVLSLAQAIELDINSTSSILAAASTIKDHILSIYNSNSTGPAIPGLFPQPYYFWEGGLAFDSLINYVTLSGDQSVVSTIQDGMLFQVGPDNNYMPPNQSRSLGNDDQATWALAAMTAAEQNFPEREGQEVSWLQLAKNVFDSQAVRWDESSCGGGLKWQIFSFNNGYNYKNSMTQGSFALLAARLARYTGNSTYTDWANKAVAWSQNIGLITYQGAIYDGTDDLKNCSDFNHIQWTINSGLFMNTNAYLVNASFPNATRTNFGTPFSNLFPVVNTSLTIFTDRSASASSNGRSILYEVACAPSNNCNVDQLSFRAPLARGLASVRDLVPPGSGKFQNISAADWQARISSVLQASALGAAAQCSGGESGTVCGSDWTSETWDGSEGLGQDLAAMEVILANLPGAKLSNSSTTTATDGTTTSGGNGTATGSAPVESETTNGVSGVGMSMALVGMAALFWAVV